MEQVKRLRCVQKDTGRVRFIMETLATNPRWMERHGLIIEEILKPEIDATKKGNEQKDSIIKHQEVDARGVQAKASGSNFTEQEEAQEVDAFADFTKPTKTKKTK